MGMELRQKLQAPDYILKVNKGCVIKIRLLTIVEQLSCSEDMMGLPGW